MINRSNWNEVFEVHYDSFFIKPNVLRKIQIKHSVYLNELEDALDDPFWVIRKNKKKDPKLPSGIQVKGVTYDVFCETSEGRLLKVIGRLYDSGRFQIITTIPEMKISEYDRNYYNQEKELICYE